MAPRDPSKMMRYLRMLNYQDRMRRRRFLTLMAAAGATTIGATTLAACGDDDDDGVVDEPDDDDADEPDDDTDDEPAADPDDIDYTDVEGYEQDDRWAGKTLVVADWGGSLRDAYRQAVYDPFSQLTGCTIVEDTSDSALLRSQVESENVEWSLANEGGTTSLILGRDGLLEELDYDVIDADGLFDGVAGEYTLSAYYWSTVLAYNTDAYGDNPPEGWADFWDLDNVPGSRGLYDWPVWNLEYALIADGVPIDDLYPVDIDRAFEVMDRIKEDILVWWDAGAQPPQLLADGELDLSSAWSGRIATAQDEGLPIGVQWNQGTLSVDRYVVPRGAPEREAAMDLINFMIRPEVQARFAALIPYGPTDERAFDYLEDDVIARLPSSPDLMDLQFEMDHDFWIEHQDETIERWQDWLLS
jgi:putative spermidine/putrescine transport system substrate-binding protein